MKSFLISALTALVVVMCGKSYALDAPSDLRPAGLNPGDTFFIIFTTSTTDRFCDGSVAQLNTHGTNAAAAGSKTSGVTGWQSLYIHESSAALGVITDTVAASGTAFNNVTNRPIYNTALELVANDRSDLFDGSTSGAGTALINAINYDENAVQFNTSSFTFTGFDELGARVPGSTLGYGGTGCRAGEADRTNGLWADSANSNSSRSLYVLSPLLTIPTATSTPAPKISTLPVKWK